MAVTLTKESDHARLTMRVRCERLSTTEMKRVFDRFYQVRGGSGAGLGLAIAKSWIVAHRGRISVSANKEDRGCTFGFEIPVKVD